MRSVKVHGPHVAVASLLIVVGSAAHAGESLWIDLEATRILAPLCPAETRRVLGTLALADLSAATALIRQRETAFTAEVLTKGDLAAAGTAMSAYATMLEAELRDGVARMGCAAAFERLGLGALPQDPHALLRAAQETPLPSTKRPADLPKRAQFGSQAAIGLQRAILLQLADETHRCDPDTAQATPVTREPVLAKHAPPFVGYPEIFTETWRLTCDGTPKAFTVTFRQDARAWRSYDLAPEKPAP